MFVRTTGRSPYHATLTGLTPEQVSKTAYTDSPQILEGSKQDEQTKSFSQTSTTQMQKAECG